MASHCLGKCEDLALNLRDTGVNIANVVLNLLHNICALFLFVITRLLGFVELVTQRIILHIKRALQSFGVFGYSNRGS